MLLWSVSAVCVRTHATPQRADTVVFSLLNLDYPGLEAVKEACARKDYNRALERLLYYYRHRTNVRHPDVDTACIHVSAQERKWADEALEHTFFAHSGYQPSLNYGKDIDWHYWPVKDNELRWQLHRHKWFFPMAKTYYVTGDERYAREWVLQFTDWIEKNPLLEIDKDLYELQGDARGEAENVRFAWRPLETAHRLEDQTRQFPLFVTSPVFTPGFLALFLENYHRHALHVLANYSAEGNHLLFEAQRMVYAGVYFPEFKEADEWRKSGIGILNREIKRQVYPDGGQYELDLHYHAAAINIFRKALEMADVNGLRDEFPPSYIDTMERMIVFYVNLLFPDYSIPCFSDSKRASRRDELKNLQAWQKLFPKNELLRWIASEGREGKTPEHLSQGFTDSGFFALRNGWDESATVMIVKAGPKGEWHCQPDNGTFELWYNGRNLFPDSGFYIYAGEGEVMKQRNWFRQTRVHNTLTLDNRNLHTTQSVTRLWQSGGKTPTLVTENPSYPGLTHRRTVFFVDQRYFVLVDEALGEATGNIDLHYQLADGRVQTDSARLGLFSRFEGESNVALRCFASQPCTLLPEEGWYSTEYRLRKPRTAVAFRVVKSDGRPVRYITVIVPGDGRRQPDIEAHFVRTGTGHVMLAVEVDGKKELLEYRL